MDSPANNNTNWLAFSLSNHPSYAGPKLEDFLGPAAAAIQPSSTDTAADVDSSGDLVTVLRTPPSQEVKKVADTFGQRTSIYRGVTRHRWTGRYEAHLWDNSCRREGQSRKGRQVYLGGYDKEDKAARAYDLAALKYWGPTTTTNFPVENYEKELEEMKNMTRQEFVASLRRKSSGFSRGASIYRGVTRHHQHGRWQARIGRVAGNKDLYLGTFSTQEEAAEAYDIAAIKFRGLNAVTNFDMSRYDIKSIANSSLPVGGLSNRTPKATTETSSSSSIDLPLSLDMNQQIDGHDSSSLNFSVLPMKPDVNTDYWSLLALQHHQQQQHQEQQQQLNNTSSLGFGLFPSGVNMDFTAPVPMQMNQGLVWHNGIWQQDQAHEPSQSSEDIPYATPVYAQNYDGSINWGAMSQSNVGFYNQTPIYGIE